MVEQIREPQESANLSVLRGIRGKTFFLDHTSFKIDHEFTVSAMGAYNDNCRYELDKAINDYTIIVKGG